MVLKGHGFEIFVVNQNGIGQVLGGLPGCFFFGITHGVFRLGQWWFRGRFPVRFIVLRNFPVVFGRCFFGVSFGFAGRLVEREINLDERHIDHRREHEFLFVAQIIIFSLDFVKRDFGQILVGGNQPVGDLDFFVVLGVDF